MKKLLVLTTHPETAAILRGAEGAEAWEIIERLGVEEAEPLLLHHLVDACVMDLDLDSVQAIWRIDKFRKRAPRCPLIIRASRRTPERDEEAYERGVLHIVDKAARGRMILSLLERKVPAAVPEPAAEEPAPPSREETIESRAAQHPHPLGLLRNISGVLSHTLDEPGMVKQFLLLLRELLGVNRAAIFLSRPAELEADSEAGARGRLRPVAAVGIPPDLLRHAGLSFESGLGRQLQRAGRILRRESPEARGDAEVRRELERLGAQVAVPVLDRESILGVAVFDRRVTGEPLTSEDLELVFHLLEQLGMGLRNLWLHAQMEANHERLAGILGELTCACLVVSRELAIPHANKAARRIFGVRGGELSFAGLPADLGSRIYQVLKTGSSLAAFRWEPPARPGGACLVSITPFRRGADGLPASALVTAEDITESEQLRALEIEAARLRLVQSMADRLTHEVGNALVPLSIHQQLLGEKWRDPKFRATLGNALGEGIRRVNRLVSQMRFLARDTIAAPAVFPLEPVIEEAYQEALAHQPSEGGQLRFEKSGEPVRIKGDRAALRHALMEVMLNALQAGPREPRVSVKLRTRDGGRMAEIEVQDAGAGFTAESAGQAFAPFTTTRNVGLGLGLPVSRKIIETHQGRIEAAPAPHGLVQITLPVAAE